MSKYRIEWAGPDPDYPVIMFRFNYSVIVPEPITVKVWRWNASTPKNKKYVEIVHQTYNGYFENVYFSTATGTFDSYHKTYSGASGFNVTSFPYIDPDFVKDAEGPQVFEFELDESIIHTIILRSSLDTSANSILNRLDVSIADLDPLPDLPPTQDPSPAGRYVFDYDNSSFPINISGTPSENYGAVSATPIDFEVRNAGDTNARIRFAVTPDIEDPAFSVSISEEGSVTASGATLEVKRADIGITLTGLLRIELTASEDLYGWGSFVINGNVWDIQNASPSPYSPPTLNPVEVLVDYRGVAVVDVTATSTSIDGDFDTRTLKVMIEGGNWADVLDIPEALIQVLSNGQIRISPKAGIEGSLPVIYWKIASEYGVEAESTLNVTVAEEPAVPMLPIEPLDDVKWVLASFRTGEIVDTEIPVTSDRVKIDVFGDDEADVTISLSGLSDEDRTNWRTKFLLNDSMLALVDSTDAVPFAGYIAKRSPDLSTETVTFKVKSMKAWLATRFVSNNLSNINDSSVTWDMTASPRTIVKALVQNAFLGSRHPKCIIFPASKGGNYSVSYLLSELKPISEAIDDISRDPNGAEIRFVPEKSDGRIVFNIVEGNPHWNDSGIADIAINLADPNMVAVGFDQIESAEDFYTTQWLESDFEGKEGVAINLSKREISGNSMIREKKDKIGASLTENEYIDQFMARIEDAGKTTRSNTLSIWDEDFSFWASIGRRIELVGDGRTAEMDDIVRCLGVNFSTSNRAIDLILANIQRVYPPLPKKLKDLESRLDWDRNLGSSSGGGGGNDTPPWNPGEGGTGEWDNSGLWGDEGMPGEGGGPKQAVDPSFDTFKTINVFDPDSPLPGTIVQNEGNRLYGLTRVNFHSLDTPAANQDETKFPLTGIQDVKIMRSFMNNGSISEWTEVQTIPSSIFRQAWLKLPLSVEVSGTVLNRVFGGMIHSIFIVRGRMYLIIGIGMGYGNAQNVISQRRVKSVMFSAPMDSNGGVGAWIEDEEPPLNHFFTGNSATRVGSYIIFGTAAILTESQAENMGRNSTQRPFNNAPGNYLFKPSGIEKWTAYPACGFGDTSVKPSILRSFGGWIYAIPYGDPLPEIWKMRGTASGIYDPLAAWTKAITINVTAGSTLTARIRNIVPIRGYMLFDSGSNSGLRAPNASYAMVAPDGKLNDQSTLVTGSYDFPGFMLNRAMSHGWNTGLYSDSYSDRTDQAPNGSRIFSFGNFLYQIEAGNPSNNPNSRTINSIRMFSTQQVDYHFGG